MTQKLVMTFFFGLWLAGVFVKLKPPQKISRSATVAAAILFDTVCCLALHAPELLKSEGAGQIMHKFMQLRATWLANLKTR